MKVAPDPDISRATMSVRCVAGGVVRVVKVGFSAVVVENAEDLHRALMGGNDMRDHGGELGHLARVNQDCPLPQLQPGNA